MDEWLLEGDPWVRYQVYRSRQEKGSHVIHARDDLLAYPPFRLLIDRVRGSWPPLVSHKSAGHPLHQLSFIASSGLTSSELGIAPKLGTIMSDQDKEGIPRLGTRISNAHGGTDKEVLAWALCDAPILLRALIDLEWDGEEVAQAIDRLKVLVRENGWPCHVSSELGSFRGPGRKSDPCPYATLSMLRLLAGHPSMRKSKEADRGVECLLDLWQRSREIHPYIFYMGTDFRKLKFPTIWYDILSVLDVVSSFEKWRDDDRMLEMAEQIRSKADIQGKFTPESIWMDWKSWDFGQKNRPSRGLTFAVWKVLDRLD